MTMASPRENLLKILLQKDLFIYCCFFKTIKNLTCDAILNKALVLSSDTTKDIIGCVSCTLKCKQ